MYKKKIFSFISTFLNSKKHLPSDLWKQISDYSFRQGKYIRPMMIVVFGKALGIKNTMNLYKLGALYQLLTDWGLAEDDIIDYAEKRRGDLTLHKKYGFEFAVNSMDLLHNYFFEMILYYFGRNKDTVLKLISFFTKYSEYILLGQYLDLYYRKIPLSSFSKKHYFKILKYKTGYLNGYIPLLLSEFFSERKLPEKLLYSFGIKLGIAYQLKDDILDMDVKNRNDKLFSKSYGNDIYEGKKTILILLLYKKLKGKYRKKLENIYKKHKTEKTKKEIDFIINFMYEYKVLEEAKKILWDLEKEVLDLYDKKIFKYLQNKKICCSIQRYYFVRF